ncbi:MAG TPA: phosphopantothenoylcysteine decarboxylase [Acidobacteriota bacterium]|nr:phosphopantothenoylcysteine decarboxylase [Acidobacteriota bacterium]
MKSVLVTAGSTMVPIDRVRAITNIFKGRTGTNIALYFAQQGWKVKLITSNPSLLEGKHCEGLSTEAFHTYCDLFCAMKSSICSDEKYDAIVHSAAVSDYRVQGTFVYEPERGMQIVGSNGKISSSFDELYLRLVPTQKIVDLIREHWGYEGYLVKFKLQTMMSDEQLLKIAEESRVHSKAEMMVANCLEWSNERAFVMTEGRAVPVARANLPEAIMKGIGL